MQYFNDISSYSQEAIDEVRESWVTYVLKNKIVDEEEEEEEEIVGMEESH